MDLSETIVPKSDQLNADDLIAGPVTVTVDKVTKGSDEQPANVHLVEFPGRCFRPSKSMRRVLVECWGKESSNYSGRRLTLYREPTITFAGEQIGGIRISHLSDIDGPKTVALTITRGKREKFTVQPLAQAKRSAPEQKASQAQLDKIEQLADDLGLDVEAKLGGIERTIGRRPAAAEALSKTEAAQVVESLTAAIERRDAAK